MHPLQSRLYHILVILTCISLLNLSIAPALSAMPLPATPQTSRFHSMPVQQVSGANTIAITNSGFTPGRLTVVTGTEVTWQNETATTQVLRSGAPENAIYLPLVRQFAAQQAAINPQNNPTQALDDSFEITLAPGTSFAHTYQTTGTYTFYLISSPERVGTIIVNPAGSTLQLTPVGNQTALLGNTLSLQLAATGGSGTLAFGITPLPLPPNVVFDAGQALFTFQPSETQIGTYTFTFAVTDGQATDVETITVAVPAPDPNAETSLRGRILDANEAETGKVAPIVGATVRYMGSNMTATTDSDGYFTMSGLMPGERYFEYDGSTANPSGLYGAYRGQKNLIAHVMNVIARPIYIMKIDKAAETTVNPNTATVIRNPDPNVNVTVNIPANTVVNDAGAPYQGPISVSRVPNSFTPASLPSTLDPSLVLTVQPMGLVFRQPAPVSFPNTNNLPPGSELNIWSLDHELGRFFIAGKGRVSNDGKMIETIEGGIRESSWHFIMPPSAAGGGAKDGSSDNQKKDCTNISSSLSLSDGCLESSFALPSYLSLGEARQLEFSYRSERADPEVILPFEATLPVRAAVPPQMSYRLLSFGGINGGNEVYLNTSSFNENKDEPLRGAVAVAGEALSTGIYPYKIRLTSHYASSKVSSDIDGRHLLVNEKNSPFGSGWNLVGLERLYLQSDGNILLTNGNGAAARFELANMLLDDNFDSENGGFEQLNYNNALNWIVTKGTIDVAGNGSTNDILPGNGMYIDLDGSTQAAGRMESNTTFLFTPGEYKLIFDIAGSQRDEATSMDSVVVSMGSLYSETFTLRRDTPFTPIIRAINVNQPTSAKLIFDSSDFPGDNKGLLLDNVKLQRIRTDSGTFDFSPLTLAVTGRSNIFGAGHRITPAPSGGGGGVRPPGVGFLAGEQEITFPNITGGVNCYAQYALNGPDGGNCPDSAPTNMSSFGGISGIVQSKTLFLTGVFVGNTEPSDPAPSRLDFTSNTDFTQLSPALNQTFFIGDGRTSSGELQKFHVPLGAMGFFLGFVDGAYYQSPGYYDDNGGKLDVQLAFHSVDTSADKFTSPAGDFSTLVRNPDGTYTRRLKDGTARRFNMAGLQTAMVDRNGNTTVYAYDGDGRLTSITDPAGLVTNFAYNNGRISQVTDPTGRITTFTHDSAGNLTGVAFPDSTQQSFGYDGKHLMTSETDRRGQTRTRTYDAYGRLVSAALPNGVVRSANYSQKVGISAPGQGTVDNPAPITLPADARSTVTDGEGRITTYTIGSLGTIATTTDAAGFTTKIDRDANANPLKTTTPSGNVYDTVYDGQGNLTSFNDSAVPGLTRYVYDASFNQVTSVTDSFNNVTSFAYDAKGNLTQVTSPLNRKVQMAYDSRGLPTSLTDLLGTTTVLGYDSQGYLTSLTVGSGADARPATFTYTTHGYLQSLTDPLGRMSSYTYDAFGRITAEALPGSRSIAYQYDGEGNLTAIKPPDRPAHLFEYDGLGQLTAYVPPAVTGSGNTRTAYEYNKAQQLTKLTRPDGLFVTYGYDAAGRLISTQFSRGSTAYAYSPTTGQLSTINAPGGVNLAYQYKGDLLTGESWSGPVAGNVQYAYDANYRTTAVSVNGTAINYQYDKDNAPIQAGNLTLAYDTTTGLLKNTSLGNVTDAWNYNAFAELQKYTAGTGGSTLYDVSYTRDKLGRITGKTEIIGGVTANYVYTYDEAGRLMEVKKDNTTVEHYTYDGNGNRLTALGGVTTSYDDQDRLLTYGNATYAYTANGELSGKTAGGQVTAYAYDEFGNLTSVTLPNGNKVEYLIDGQNRRIGKKVNGALAKGWLYEGDLRPVAEVDGSGVVISRFVYGVHVNVPEYMVRPDGTYRLITDHLGSVRLVVNSQTGAIAQRIDYDAFGNVMQDTSHGFQPFGFAGGLYDADTGLVRFGARDYDAIVGRWTAKDPNGFNISMLNLYEYTSSDPLNWFDTTGLAKQKGNQPPSFLDGIKDPAEAEKSIREHFPNDPQAQKDAMRQWEKREGHRQSSQRRVVKKLVKKIGKKCFFVAFLIYDVYTGGPAYAANEALWPLSEMWTEDCSDGQCGNE